MDQNQITVFDQYGKMNDARKDFMDQLIPQLISMLALKTAIDAGCGLGFFSNALSALGLDVTGFDARDQNIKVAKKRYPNIKFHFHDAEKSEVLSLGTFDLLLCFGLLYHLENPFRVIRNMWSLTRKVMIIESMIVPQSLPVSILIDEEQGIDQALQYVAFISSETGLVKMLYRAGFKAVYKSIKLPEHDDFKNTVKHRKRRTVLIASKEQLNLPTLQEVPEPKTFDVWSRKGIFNLERFLMVILNRLK